MISNIAAMCKEKSNNSRYYELRLDYGEYTGVILERDKITDSIRSDYWFDLNDESDIRLALHYISQ